jgi:hypothetical protein
MADRRSNGIEYRVNLAADEIGQRRPENITQIDRAGRRQRERAMPAEDIEYDGGLMSYGENVSLLSSAYDARIVTARKRPTFQLCSRPNSSYSSSFKAASCQRGNGVK